MTAPSREPTEAMRQLGHDIACRICGVWDRARGADIIARALMEQDAAAKGEGVEMAAKWHEEQAHEMQKRYYEIRDLGDDPGGADQSRAFHLDCAGNLRALTPEPPGEKENEGG